MHRKSRFLKNSVGARELIVYAHSFLTAPYKDPNAEGPTLQLIPRRGISQGSLKVKTIYNGSLSPCQDASEFRWLVNTHQWNHVVDWTVHSCKAHLGSSCTSPTLVHDVVFLSLGLTRGIRIVVSADGPRDYYCMGFVLSSLYARHFPYCFPYHGLAGQQAPHSLYFCFIGTINNFPTTFLREPHCVPCRTMHMYEPCWKAGSLISLPHILLLRAIIGQQTMLYEIIVIRERFCLGGKFSIPHDCWYDRAEPNEST